MAMEFKNMVVKRKVYEKEIDAKNEIIDVLKKSQAQSEFETEQNQKKMAKGHNKIQKYSKESEKRN